MNASSLLVVSALAGFIACADVQDPMASRSSAMSRSDKAGAPPTVGTPSVIIFSNFGPELSFDRYAGNSIVGGPQGRAADQDQSVSVQFQTPPGEYTFARATVALGRNWLTFGRAGRFRVVLQADTFGRPGRVIEQMSIDSVARAPTTYSLNSALLPVLRDSLYWLTVAPLDDSATATWFSSTRPDSTFTQWAITRDGELLEYWYYSSGLQRRNAFQVEGRLLPRIEVCHRTSGDSPFVLIAVPPTALDAHRAHGDGRPGGAVPKQPGMRFNADCGVELIPQYPPNQWHEQSPYPAQACTTRPAGTTCLRYRDAYCWLVTDVIIGWETRRESIGAIDTAIGESGARYEHVINTSLVRVVR